MTTRQSMQTSDIFSPTGAKQETSVLLIHILVVFGVCYVALFVVVYRRRPAAFHRRHPEAF